MIFQVLADLVVIVHFAFVIFVVAGGLIVFKWRKVILLHLPAAIWGALIEFAGWICPLTPLENWLRRKGGASDYSGDFVNHYIMPILYPSELTREVQVVLGVLVVVSNIAIYGYFTLKKDRRFHKR
jgi:hypothetical protein